MAITEGLVKVGSVAADLAKNEQFQKASGGLLSKVFPTFGIEKRAVDAYVSEIEKSDMSADAKLLAIMSVKDKLKGIKNQKAIISKCIESAPEDTDFSASSKVKEDFFDKYMDSARFVSDEMMQDIWGQILAGEFKNPGTTPSSMVRVLSEITPEYAQAFRTLCNMKVVYVGIDKNNNITSAIEKLFVPVNANDELMTQGITISVINELEAIGLLKSAVVTGYVNVGMSGRTLIYTNGATECIDEYPGHEDRLPSGDILFTAAGECLSRITPKKEVDGYAAMVKKYLERKNVKFLTPNPYEVDLTNAGNNIQVRVKYED